MLIPKMTRIGIEFDLDEVAPSEVDDTDPSGFVDTSGEVIMTCGGGIGSVETGGCVTVSGVVSGCDCDVSGCDCDVSGCTGGCDSGCTSGGCIDVSEDDCGNGWLVLTFSF